VEHKLAPLTVDDFIANTRAIEKFTAGVVTAEAEIDMITGMLMRAFPTMTKEMLGRFTLPQLNKLVEFAQEHNGQKKVETEAAAEATENPPTAG
jgi:hypothetical protein